MTIELPRPGDIVRPRDRRRKIGRNAPLAGRLVRGVASPWGRLTEADKRGGQEQTLYRTTDCVGAAPL